jgi:hypothetical protein
MHRENKGNVTLDYGLLKWKHMHIYVLKGKLHTRIVEEEHDVFTTKHQGKNPLGWLWLNILLAQNKKRHKTLCEDLCEVSKH